jgi:hypothetical protein
MIDNHLVRTIGIEPFQGCCNPARRPIRWVFHRAVRAATIPDGHEKHGGVAKEALKCKFMVVVERPDDEPSSRVEGCHFVGDFTGHLL